MKHSALETLRIRNFKAIRDSGLLRLTPLTVFIGNNGSGKSSVLEALETLQMCVDRGLDAAMQMWRGIEHIRNKSRPFQVPADATWGQLTPGSIIFELTGRVEADAAAPRAAEAFEAITAWDERAVPGVPGAGPEEKLLFNGEWLRVGSKQANRFEPRDRPVPPDLSLFAADPLGRNFVVYVEDWQFVSLSPQAMGEPTPQTRSSKRIRLGKDGANVAEYLQDIRNTDPAAFAGIIEALRTVLPYADDLQPALTSELERTVYLQLAERDFKVPGWLLSTGTLRILALLALLRHPKPPPLIAIEEIENGLDPRTVHLLVEEIRVAVESGRTQVIATSHSPYLLDLVPLSAIIFVERIGDEPRFSRPADSKEVLEWAKSFAPGQLFTMQRLRGEAQS
jgi:ABC-type transport system involved in cytochrome c biogenesis ATPase subunit